MSDVAGVIERLKLQAEIGLLDAAELPGFKVVSYTECVDLLSSLSARIAELERERNAMVAEHTFAAQSVAHLHARAEAAEAKLAKAEEALSSAEAWLERWAVHVGRCAGGDRCTCGLTLVRAEVLAALSPMPNKEG